MGGDTPKMKETAYEKALADVAKAKWKDYKRRYVPFEKKAIRDVTDKATNRILTDRIAGTVNADLAEQMPLSALPVGVDPSSGRVRTALNALNKASRGGSAIAEARQAGRDLRVEGLKAAVDIGRGQATEAQLGLTDLASSSVKKKLENAYSDFDERSSTSNMVGSALGIGAAVLDDAIRRR